MTIHELQITITNYSADVLVVAQLNEIMQTGKSLMSSGSF